MVLSSEFEVFEDKEKAIHACLWKNFSHRQIASVFCVVTHPEDSWAVCKSSFAEELEIPPEVIPENYTALSYKELSHIRMDEDPLRAWEEICGMFSVADGEFLRFILHAKIPLEKLIRYELASRGHDKNTRWVGFEKAKKIWLI